MKILITVVVLFFAVNSVAMFCPSPIKEYGEYVADCAAAMAMVILGLFMAGSFFVSIICALYLIWFGGAVDAP